MNYLNSTNQKKIYLFFIFWIAILIISILFITDNILEKINQITLEDDLQKEIIDDQKNENNTEKRETPITNEVISKTIQVITSGCKNENSDKTFNRLGSGVLISNDGYVVSNAHIFEGCKSTIYIANSIDSITDTSIIYTAEVKNKDQDLDLALLKINKSENLKQTNLDFPFFVLKNNDNLILGESIYILGYPTLRSDRDTNNLKIHITRGTVSGFEYINHFPNGWIVTDGDISYGNSGGAVIDQKGNLVGIPVYGVSEGTAWIGYILSINVIIDWLNNENFSFFDNKKVENLSLVINNR